MSAVHCSMCSCICLCYKPYVGWAHEVQHCKGGKGCALGARQPQGCGAPKYKQTLQGFCPVFGCIVVQKPLLVVLNAIELQHAAPMVGH